MNKTVRMIGLVLVLSLVCGFGFWQQQSWASEQAGNGLKQIGDKLKQLISPAAASKVAIQGTAAPMATITVTSTGDGTANTANCPHATNCRLRDAIAKAVDGDTISFSVSGLITLNSGALSITKNLTIQGPGSPQLTISGNNANGVFIITSGDTVTINDLTIANGNSTTTGGGINNSGTLTLNDCRLSTNRATNGGGGIYNQGSLTITDSTLSANSSSTGSGGGIFITAGLVNILNSTLSSNSANVGGAIANASTVILTGSTLYDNSTATNGGGIFNQATLGLTNSTLSGNRAPSGSGGGIYGNSSASSILNNCTLTNNSAANGGGIEAISGLLQARNTIIAGNTATGLGQDIYGSLNSAGNNLIGNSSGVSIGGDPFSNILNVNPRLASLANYGGATQTHALLPGSPAIDAGEDCVVQSGGCLSTPLVTDQRGTGFPRKTGSVVDIGAFESRGFTLTAAGGNNQSTGTNTAFPNPLSVTITATGSGEPVNGGQVTFTPPVSGASATLTGNPATISNGAATTATVTANGISGSYNVAANAKGVSAIVNFALTNVLINTAPSFTPAAVVSRQLGSSAGTSVNVGTVTDGQTAAGSLTVTQITGGSATGITVSGITNTNGTITAMISTSCTATSGTVRFLVSDGSLTGTGDLQINLTANTGPTLAYTAATVTPGGATTVGPSIGPVDNGSIASIVVQSTGTYTGTISVNNSTGVVSLSNAGPQGNHTITIRATDNCGLTTNAALTLSVSSSAISYKVLSFGINSFGELSIPDDIRSGATAMAAGAYHSLVVKNGRVYAYGYNLNGQTNVPVEAQSGVTAVAAAYNHSLALKNGGVIAWGELGSGIPVAAQSGVTAMAAGDFHGLFLKNGGVIGWGSNSQNQTTIPTAAQSGVTAIAAGDSHSLALKNGGVIAWGYNFEGQVTVPAAALNGVTAIAAGERFSLAVKNGGVIGWGRNFYGELNIPVAAQSGVIAIAARAHHSLALKSTGEVISWGQSAPVIPAFAQSGVVSISTGDFHHLVMKPTSPPSITATSLTRQQGTAGSVATVATVVDSQTSAGNLTVAATTVPSGITVNTITNSGGTITANIAASCTAVVGANTVVLTVTDGDGETATTNLTVNVTANTSPLLSYGNVSVSPGSSTTNSPTVATDNGSITGYAVQPQATFTGSLTVNASGVVSISNAAPVGTHTITIRATDNCGSTTNAAFTLTVNNTPPTISAAAALTRQRGTTGTGSTIATVSDGQTPAGSLIVTATTVPAGITVTSITNVAGTITANVSASCTATIGANTVALTVTDGNSGTATANLTINVTANTPPTLTYAGVSVNAGSSTTNTPTSATDNGSIASFAVQSQGAYTGTISVNTSGVVSISNAAPVGAHTITVRATDNCGSTTDATFTLTVNNTLPTITAAAALSRQRGTAGTVSTIASVNDGQTPAGSLVVTATTVPAGITVASITNTAGTITANVAAGCTATIGTNTVVLTVTDGNSGTATANLTINVTANTAPTVTYANVSMNAGSSTTNPTTVATDNGSITGYAVQSQGTYTGTITVNAAGVVSISNAAPVGIHTITVRATDNCGSTTDATFTLTVNNTLPTITAAAALSRQRGTAGTVSTIATVSDGQTPAGSLVVTATTVPAGITITSIANTAGTITANVAASCTATIGANTVVLTVTDGNSGTATANLTINVTANTAPTVSYANISVNAGSSMTNAPTAATDNGSITSFAVQSQGTYTGTITVNASGVVSISAAVPIGAHTITIRATDNCGTTTDATFTLTVNNTLPTITAAAALTRQRGSAGTVSTIATVGDGQTPVGSLVVTATTVPAGITITSITNTAGTITANVAASCTATIGANTVVLTVTDGNSGTATANLTVNVTANTAPTLTYAATSVNSSGSTTNSPTAATDNGSITGYAVQSSGTYTGTISVNASGVVSVSAAAPVGAHTITIRATDNCGTTTNATFTLTVGNNVPTITAAAALTRQRGSAGTVSTIATVNDGETPVGSLVVTATTVPTGITITSITNTTGTISASVAASCTATLGANTVVLTVTDGNSGTATANLIVNVTANTAPTVTYGAVSVIAGGSTSNSPTSASDNGTITGYAVQSPGTYTGTISVNASGAVSISNAAPAGTHTITIRATDNCGATANATFTLTVTNTPPTIAAQSGTTREQGASASNSQIATVNDAESGANGVTVTINGGASATVNGVTVSNIVNSGGTVTANIAATCGASNASFTLTATDGHAATATATLNVAVTGITLSSLVNGLTFVPYTATLTATGGTGSYTFSLVSGTLPAGLSLNGNVLSGTPTTAGASTFRIRATDDGNTCFGERVFTVNIGSTGLMYYPLARPVRLLDTRPGASANACFQPNAPIAGNTSRLQPARGTCEGLTIPANATTITGHVTTVQSGGGFLTLYPSDAPQPQVTSSNYLANEVLNNAFTVGLGSSDGAFKIFVSSDTDLVVDVTGYYAPPGAGGLYFHPLPKPIRLLETRQGFTGCQMTGAPLQTGTTRTQTGVLTCDGVTIPTGAQSLVGNVTTTNSTGSGYLTLYPADAAQPFASSSNFAAGINRNAPFTVGLSVNGEFNIFTARTTDLIIDVMGYYSAQANDASGQGLLFTSLGSPLRLLDTQAGQSACYTPGAPMTGGAVYTQDTQVPCTNLTSVARGLVGNVSAFNATANGFVTFWPSNAAQPTVATSNYQASRVFNRHFTVGLGPDVAFKRFTSSTTDVIIDISGFFAP